MPIFMKKKTKTLGRILRRIIVTILVLALLAGGAWIACRALKQEYSVTYQGYTATTGSISNALSFSGQSQSGQQRELFRVVGLHGAHGVRLCRG